MPFRFEVFHLYEDSYRMKLTIFELRKCFKLMSSNCGFLIDVYISVINPELFIPQSESVN